MMNWATNLFKKKKPSYISQSAAFKYLYSIALATLTCPYYICVTEEDTQIVLENDGFDALFLHRVFIKKIDILKWNQCSNTDWPCFSC